MAQVEEVAGGTLGEVNIAAGAMIGFIGPLSAQIDAVIALGLGPLQADLNVEYSVNLSVGGTITVTDPISALRNAIAAMVQLQATLQLALTLPTLQLGVSVRASAALSASAALEAKLGLINGLIKAALAVKLPAVQAAAEFAAALSAGPIIALSFDGIADGTSLANIGANTAAKFGNGLSFDGVTIAPADPVSGVMLVTKGASVYAALGAIITT